MTGGPLRDPTREEKTVPGVRKRTLERAPPRWILPVLIVATLTIGGWFVIDNLASTSKLEDCTMSGRKNCVPPIDTSKLPP
jgi:hypothetical protein